MVGTHLLKCWSSTQAGVAMSSGEAEFYGAVKGAAAGLGMKALYRDIGYQLPLRLWTDSSAAVGICSRQGLGKLRHLECTSLWIQQRIRLGELEVRKIAGEVNPADLYTKHLESKAKIEQLVQLFGGEFRDGRPAASPQLKKDTAAAVMTEVLYSQPEPPGGETYEMTVLPHLMMPEDADRLYDVAKLDDIDNSKWADLIKPADELKDPGPNGLLEFTPAVMRGDASLICYDDLTTATTSPSTITDELDDTRHLVLTSTLPTTNESYDTLVPSTTLPITMEHGEQRLTRCLYEVADKLSLIHI